VGQVVKYDSYDQWRAWVFDHADDEPPWDGDDPDWWGGPPQQTVEFVTRLFHHSQTDLGAYTDEQVNEGLTYLIRSEHASTVLDASIPWPMRRQCIRSMFHLFAGCFASRCSPHLSHIDERWANPLNSVCYMWWESFPVHGHPEDPAFAAADAEFIDLMARMLELDSIPCQESALHGLGHWQVHYPDRIASLIESFLATHNTLRTELVRYARSAQVGAIL
jgi:hypothetical protein